MRPSVIIGLLMSLACVASASDDAFVKCSECAAIAAQDYTDCINGNLPVCKVISCTPTYCTAHSNGVLNRCLANCTGTSASIAASPAQRQPAASKAPAMSPASIPASFIKTTR